MSDQLIISLVTVPDIAGLRLIHKLEGLSDEGVLSASLHLHQQKFGNAELPLYQQQIISIAVVKCSASGSISVDCPTHFKNESELLQWFVDQFDSEDQLISWNITAIDKPLLTYRLLKHGIVSDCFSKQDTTAVTDNLSNSYSDSVADLAGLCLSLGLPDDGFLSRAVFTDCFIKKQLAPVHKANRVRALNVCTLYQKYQMINALVSAEEFETVTTALAQAHG